MREIRHLGFWSNPYLYEDFLEEIPQSLTGLREVTVCSNYMSGLLSVGALENRVAWILKMVRKVPTLQKWNFLTGCGISPGSRLARDCGFAEELRRCFDCGVVIVEGVEYGKFGTGFKIKVGFAVVNTEGEERSKEVELKIASVYEDGFYATSIN